MKIKEKLKNNKYLMSIILIVIALLVIVGITYASFNIDLGGLTNIKAEVPLINFTYVEAPSPLIQTNKVLSLEEHKTSNDYFEFKVSSTSNTIYNLYYNIYLTEKDTNTLSKDNLYIYLTKVNNGVETAVVNVAKLTSLTKYTKYSNSYIITSNNFNFLTNNEETKEVIYRLRIWNDAVNTDTNIAINGGVYEYTVSVDTVNK